MKVCAAEPITASAQKTQTKPIILHTLSLLVLRPLRLLCPITLATAYLFWRER